MLKQQNRFVTRALAVLASRRFFVVIVVALVLQALWIALSSKFPMAFDEDFHLGVIRLYADHLWPFWSAPPEASGWLGPISRDPSYLFYLIMAVPYKIMTWITPNEAAQILVLRGLNIAMLAASLPLYRRLLLRSGASAALVHAVLAIFVLVPILPLLAAHINYDNMLLWLTALTLLTALKLKDGFAAKKVDARQLFYLLLLCILGTLVKYAFLPIALATCLVVLYWAWRAFPRRQKAWRSLDASFRALSRRTRWVLGVALVLSLGLFAERYAVNFVRYGAPVADCAQVQTIDECSNYGPWKRDHNLNLSRDTRDFDTSPVAYTGEWFYGMWLRSFFAVAGATNQFQTRGPLPVPATSVIILAAASALAIVVTARKLLRRYNKDALGLFALVTGLYVLVLWQDEYGMYLHTGEPVAINGRYLLPILPLVLLICGMAWVTLLRKQWLKLGFFSVVLLCFLWGGGALTYILRSNDAWYWSVSPVRQANHAIQRVLGPITPGYDTPTKFLR